MGRLRMDKDRDKGECRVCGAFAKIGLHYGALTCYKCRAFFRLKTLSLFIVFTFTFYHFYGITAKCGLHLLQTLSFLQVKTLPQEKRHEPALLFTFTVFGIYFYFYCFFFHFLVFTFTFFTFTFTGRSNIRKGSICLLTD